jgi:hypothetical protein
MTRCDLVDLVPYCALDLGHAGSCAMPHIQPPGRFDLLSPDTDLVCERGPHRAAYRLVYPVTEEPALFCAACLWDRIDDHNAEPLGETIVLEGDEDFGRAFCADCALALDWDPRNLWTHATLP